MQASRENNLLQVFGGQIQSCTLVQTNPTSDLTLPLTLTFWEARDRQAGAWAVARLRSVLRCHFFRNCPGGRKAASTNQTDVRYEIRCIAAILHIQGESCNSARPICRCFVPSNNFLPNAVWPISTCLILALTLTLTLRGSRARLLRML